MWMDGKEGALDRFLDSAPEVRKWYNREVRRVGEGAALRDLRRLLAFCSETRTTPRGLRTLEPTPLRLLIESWGAEKEGLGRDPSTVREVQALVRRFLLSNSVRLAVDPIRTGGLSGHRRRRA